MRRFRVGHLRHASLCALAVLIGCVSSGAEGRHRVRVITVPPGARATLGEQSVETPGSLWVTGFEPVTIRFAREGCEPQEIEVRRVHHGRSDHPAPGDGDEPEPEPRPAGSGPPVPDGPVCGVPIPLVVGLLAGAAGRVEYDDWPDRVEVRLDCRSEAPRRTAASP